MDVGPHAMFVSCAKRRLPVERGDGPATRSLPSARLRRPPAGEDASAGGAEFGELKSRHGRKEKDDNVNNGMQPEHT
jgi:hypothetical protein